MTRSLTSWFSRNAPDCHSIASTRVVFPWSTWATMATLRRSSRRGMAATHDRRSACGSLVEHTPHRLQQVGAGERLLDERGRPVLARGLDDVVLRVARDEHDRQPRTAAAQLVGEPATVEPRHHHVGHQYVDLAERLERIEGVEPVGGAARLV